MSYFRKLLKTINKTILISNPNIAWYKFAEGSGLTTADSSGNGFTGTLINSPTWTTGPNGHGALFFNANLVQYVATTCNSTLGDFTASCWFFAQASDVQVNSYQRLVDKVYNTGFYLGHFGNNGSEGDANSWGGGVIATDQPYGFGATLTLGQWNMITVTRIGSTATLYFNGIQALTTPVLPDTTSSDFLSIGGDATPTDDFTGSIADVAVWNFGLTPIQVAAWYGQGAH